MRWDTLIISLPLLQLGSILVWGFFQLGALRAKEDRGTTTYRAEPAPSSAVRA
jgi:hypothetical protein